MVDTFLNPGYGDPSSVEEFLGGFPAALWRTRDPGPLCFDPFPILSNKTLKLSANFSEVRKLGKNIHRKLDVLDRRWRDPFDFGLRYPGRADDSTGIIFVGHSLSGDVVSDREFVRAAILQVGDAIVPVVAFEAL